MCRSKSMLGVIVDLLLSKVMYYFPLDNAFKDLGDVVSESHRAEVSWFAPVSCARVNEGVPQVRFYNLLETVA